MRQTDYWGPTQNIAERQKIPWTSSDEFSASAVVKDSIGILGGLLVTADDAGGDIEVVIYDNDSAASGVVLARLNITTAVNNYQESFSSPSLEGILAEDGIYCEITGDASVIVYYK